MPTVFHSGPNNSTFFTTCCRVAINDDQKVCPRCKEKVLPESVRGRWLAAYRPTGRPLTSPAHPS